VNEDDEVEDRPWTRVGAHGVCIVGERMLMARVAPPLPDAGDWTIPGGGIDWGEAPEAAVVREFREETGVAATVEGLVGVFSQAYMRSAERPRDSLHFMSIVFRVSADDRAPLVHEVDGTTDLAAWIPLDEVGDLPLSELGRYAVGLLGLARAH
jgi:8-oxo-dGTP diphosphatase